MGVMPPLAHANRPQAGSLPSERSLLNAGDVSRILRWDDAMSLMVGSFSVIQAVEYPPPLDQSRAYLAQDSVPGPVP